MATNFNVQSLFLVIFLFGCLTAKDLTEENLNRQLNRFHEYLHTKITSFKLTIQEIMKAKIIKHYNLESSSTLFPHWSPQSDTFFNDAASLPLKLFKNVQGELPIIGAKNGSVYFLQNENYSPFANFSISHLIIDLQAFFISDQLWLIIHYQTSEAKEGVQLYSFRNMTLIPRQDIKLSGKSSVAGTFSKDSFYLAVISSDLKYSPYNSMLTLFEWQGSQFDKIATLDLKAAAKSLSVWDMEGILYMNVGLQTNRSLIYEFVKTDFKSNIVLVQFIEIDSLLFAKHFVLAHTDYLILVNEKQVNIYWWMGNQYSLFQTLNLNLTSLPLDCVLLRQKSNTLVLVSGKEVAYFVQDDTSHFVMIRIQELSEVSQLRSFVMWQSLCGYSILRLFSSLFYMEDVSLPVNYVSSPFKSCLEELGSELAATTQQLDELRSKYDKVWMKNNTTELKAKLVVNGTVHATFLRYDNMIISAENENLSLPLPSEIENEIDLQLATTSALNISRVILKSVNQTVESDLQFVTPISVNVGSLNVSGGTDLYVNGIEISKLGSALRQYGDQVFERNVVINNVKSGTIQDISLLNGIQIEDLILLNGQQYVDGEIKCHNVIAYDVSLPPNGFVNDISLDDMVLTTGNMDIIDKKYFGVLSAEHINSSDMLNLTMVDQAAIYVDDHGQFIESKLKFTSNLNIQGRLHAQGTVVSQLEALANFSVKTFSNATIEGAKHFTQLLRVERDAEVRGTLNGIKFQDILSLNNVQVVKGSWSLNNARFHQTVRSRHVNGIDFESEVVTSQEANIVEHKTFSNSIKILQDIDIVGNGLLNGISVSEMAKTVATKSMAILDNNIYLRNIVVGNLMISEYSNFPLFLLRRHVWVKSSPQRIDHPVNFEILKVQNLAIKNLNYSPFNDSFIPTIQNSRIGNEIVFEQPVHINLLSMGPGVTINGLHLSSLDTVVPSYDYVSSVSGIITISNMLVKTLKHINSLNDIEFPGGFVVKHDFQYLSGKNFSKIYVDNLNVKTMDVMAMNNVTFSSYIASAVRKHSNTAAISNKAFQNISANALLSEGYVNDVNLQDFFQRAVRLNTSQRIDAPKDFFSLEASELKTDYLFNFNLSSFLPTVVMKDGAVIHGIKRFRKMAYAKNSDLQFLNGLNITKLQQFALWKTSHSNVFWDYVRFQKFVMCRNGVNISDHKTLDGVPIESLPKLNVAKLFTLPVTFHNVIIKKNVFVYGLINNCNLSKVFDGAALHPGKPIQVFTAKTKLSYLSILGHLNVHCSINGISKSQLNVIVDRYKKSSITHNIYFANISVRNISLLGLVNDGSIQDLIVDAVLASTPQEITGNKTFPGIRVGNLHVADLYVNDTNLQNLFETVVTKQDNQTIRNKLRFKEINATSVKIKGKLNEIKIPDDLIYTTTPGLIDAHVIWNTTVTLRLNLHVSGRIDDVILASEIKNNFFLNDDSVIYSMLIFHHDTNITGETMVERSINGLLVHNLIPLKFKSIEIQGKKNFSENLSIQEELITQKINEVDVTSLANLILKRNVDENVMYMEFSAAFIASDSLNITGGVNGVSINSIWSQVHEKIDYVENRSSIILMLANQQEDFLSLIRDPVSVFAYFELQQRINVGPTTNFLPVARSRLGGDADGETHDSMIVWVDRCLSDVTCCKDVKSMRMKILANGSLSLVKEYSGKAFHFVPRNSRNKIKGFLLQNMATKAPGRCHDSYETVIKTCFVGKKRKTSNHLPNYTQSVSAAVFIEMENDLYVAVLYDSKGLNVILYRYDWDKDTWHEATKLGLLNPISLDFTYMEKEGHAYVLLAISYNSTQVPVSIYQWDMHDKRIFAWENITAARPCSTVFWHDVGMDVFLLAANEKSSIYKENTLVDVYTDPIQVYKLEEGNLILFQTIDIGGISSFESFKFSDESYILAVSRYSQAIYVIEWKGFSRFQIIQKIPAPGVLKVTPFSPENEQLMLAVSSVSGHTKILRSVVRQISLITE